MATIKFGKKAKKVGDKAQVPGPSAPLWLQTYGDFVTLVLTFFVMLLATMSSSVNDCREVLHCLKANLFMEELMLIHFHLQTEDILLEEA